MQFWPWNICAPKAMNSQKICCQGVLILFTFHILKRIDRGWVKMIILYYSNHVVQYCLSNWFFVNEKELTLISCYYILICFKDNEIMFFLLQLCKCVAHFELDNERVQCNLFYTCQLLQMMWKSFIDSLVLSWRNHLNGNI